MTDASHFGNKFAFERLLPRRGAWGWQRTGLKIENSIAMGITVVRHANHHDPLHFLLRANRTVVLTLLWVALAACVVGSLAFDVVDWLSAWWNLRIEMLTPGAAV